MNELRSRQQTFESVALSTLEGMSRDERDALEFGVVGMQPDGCADIYNQTEERLSGVSRERVIGTRFFETIGQCMNNFMVAQRFEEEADLDDIVPFVLTLRMRPTKVVLRLLAASNVDRRYVLIQR